MAEAVFMPKQGQSVETCIITEWYKKKGEKVETGDLLFSYETDKASFDEEAKSSGILLEIFFNEGDEVPVLSNVGVIGKEGENVEAFRSDTVDEDRKPDAETEHEAASKDRPEVKEVGSSKEKIGKIIISPRARAMVKDKSVNPEKVQGTGPNGRIIVRDVISYLEKTKTVETPLEKTAATDYSAYQGDFPGTTLVPLTNIRRIIAENMQASLQNSAQLTHHLSADARKILELRSNIKERMGSENLENITLNDMICYAVIQTLRSHPQINAHFLGTQIREFEKVHLGIAVDTERGLMVPVLKNADDYGLNGLASRLKKLANDRRTGKIDPELLPSVQGSFTVSNLGAYGIEMFTPVLNIPQAGILGVNTITHQPRDIGNGTIAFIPVIGLSLTYDHRAIDGAPASAFLKDLKDYIEKFQVEV
jgi:pyruvate dehydrogenase E2 component (dihydrolipoamide acetyltransferase)